MNTITITAYVITNKKTKEVVGWSPVIDGITFDGRYETREAAIEAAKAAIFDKDDDFTIKVL